MPDSINRRVDGMVLTVLFCVICLLQQRRHPRLVYLDAEAISECLRWSISALLCVPALVLRTQDHTSIELRKICERRSIGSQKSTSTSSK